MGEQTIDFQQVVVRENLFWLQILGDHAFFLWYALEEKETKWKEQAVAYREKFDLFLQQVLDSSYVNDPDFHIEVYKWVQSFKKFKLHLLDAMLHRKVEIQLVPDVVNHMLNELEEYERILSAIIKGKLPPIKTTVHHHHLWLSDASGHSSIVSSSLDPTEFDLFLEARAFKEQFDKLFLKAHSYQGFLRTKHLFPSIHRLDIQGTQEIRKFSQFLKRLQTLLRENQSLADISPYFLDHMLREECYYLQHVNELNPNLQRSSCDFSRPREMK